MKNDLADRKGFTLVELMIVVAIIGILAAIAIPSFLNFRLKAKASEAKSNLGAIRTTEVAYYAEWSMWVGNQTYTPTGDRRGNGNKVDWAVDVTRFSILGFAPEGKVFFDYNLEGTDWPTGGFTSTAQGDLDGNNATSNFTISSDTSEIFHLGATH
jgi:prepilin-type N-terminal cleavage/methylation domain-containing protein